MVQVIHLTGTAHLALDRLSRFRAYIGKDINAMERQDKARLAEHMTSMVNSDRY